MAAVANAGVATEDGIGADDRPVQLGAGLHHRARPEDAAGDLGPVADAALVTDDAAL